MKPTPFNAFLMGGLAQIGCMMAYQDWLGLEGYVKSVQSNWVDLHWMVGVSICAFSYWGFYTIACKYQLAKQKMNRK